MAVQQGNLLMHGTSGSFSRQITFKQYNGRTIITHYPDMSKVVYTESQIAERFRFKLAVAFARSVIADPAKKRAYSKMKHFSAYHAAIADYIRTSKAEEKQKSNASAEVKPISVSVKVQLPVTAVLKTESGVPIASTDDPAS